eukprot:scaffold6322_cov59-Cylindrotheca_fusiformis.AAC.22
MTRLLPQNVLIHVSIGTNWRQCFPKDKPFVSKALPIDLQSMKKVGWQSDYVRKKVCMMCDVIPCVMSI